MFHDDFLTRQGLDFWVDFAFRAAFEAHAFPPRAHDAGIQKIGVVHVPAEYHRSAGLAESMDQFFQVGENGEAAARECGGSWIQEEQLHIDHH